MVGHADLVAGDRVGNGDGGISSSTGSVNEWGGFWQHLALAGLISGTFDGQYGGGLPHQPASPISGGFYRDIDVAQLCYGRKGIRIALESNAGGTGTSGVLLASEASGIDTKMDDNLADHGQVYGTTPDAVAGSATECTTGAWNPTSATASYNLNVTNKYCRMLFWLEKFK